MKNILLIGLVIIFTSCSDFLDIDSRSSVLVEEYYLTSDGYAGAINLTYSSLRNIYGGNAFMFCSGTDMYTPAQSAGYNTEPEGLYNYSTLNPSSGSISGFYTNCYRTIQKANTAIYYSDLTEQTSNIPKYVAEVKYIRSLAYFLLVQTYGGVPIVPYIDGPVVEFDRNSAQEVYDYIITDLNDILNAVSADSYTGRVNKRAVQHLLAKIYLTRAYETFAGNDDFAKAAQFADAAINNQTLDIPFADLWWPANDDKNPEVIFSVQYSKGSIAHNPTGAGSGQFGHFGFYIGGGEVAGEAPWKSRHHLANDYALSLFEQGDERWEATFMTEFPLLKRYYDHFRLAKEDIQVEAFYAPKWFTTTDSLAYRQSHPELQSYLPFGTYTAETGTFPTPWGGGSSYVKKFEDPDSEFGSRSSTRDIILSRLGETYLIAAEAYLGAGDAVTGLARLNEVRRRANAQPATLADFDLEYILDERGRELLGEYHRWFDLKRTGTLVERATKYNSLVVEGAFVGNNGELKILRPIPQSAIDLNQNKDFPQNPAYN